MGLSLILKKPHRSHPASRVPCVSFSLMLLWYAISSRSITCVCDVAQRIAKILIGPDLLYQGSRGWWPLKFKFVMSTLQ